MALSHRVERIAEQIREEISLILATEVRDPRVGVVTVTRAKVTGDLSLARIYWTIVGDAVEKKKTKQGLEKAVPNCLQTGLTRPAVVLASDHSHYCALSVAGWLGIGISVFVVIVAIALDAMRAILHRRLALLHAFAERGALLGRQDLADIERGLQHALAGLVVLGQHLLPHRLGGRRVDHGRRKDLQGLFMQVAARFVPRLQVDRRSLRNLPDLAALGISGVQAIEQVVDRARDAFGRAVEHHHAGRTTALQAAAMALGVRRNINPCSCDDQHAGGHPMHQPHARGAGRFVQACWNHRELLDRAQNPAQ